MDAIITDSQLPNESQQTQPEYVPPPAIVIDHYAQMVWTELNEAQIGVTQETMDGMRDFAMFIKIISKMYAAHLNSN